MSRHRTFVLGGFEKQTLFSIFTLDEQEQRIVLVFA